jgi:hypothetical protein
MRICAQVPSGANGAGRRSPGAPMRLADAQRSDPRPDLWTGPLGPSCMTFAPALRRAGPSR